jgi:hypothetical protein
MKKVIKLPSNIKSEDGAKILAELFSKKDIEVNRILIKAGLYYFEVSSLTQEQEEFLYKIDCIVEGEKIDIRKKCDLLISTMISNLTVDEKYVKEITCIVKFRQSMTQKLIEEFTNNYLCRYEKVGGLSTLLKVTTSFDTLERMIEDDNVEHIKSSIPTSLSNAQYTLDNIKDKRNDLGNFNPS